MCLGSGVIVSPSSINLPFKNAEVFQLAVHLNTHSVSVRFSVVTFGIKAHTLVRRVKFIFQVCFVCGILPMGANFRCYTVGCSVHCHLRDQLPIRGVA